MNIGFRNVLASATSLVAGMVALAAAEEAAAQTIPSIELAEGLELDPNVDLLLRYEDVSQDNPAEDADALTLRARAGVTLKLDKLSFLIEGEGTLAIVDDYNDTIPGNGIEPFAVVADPENLELNRLQISYMDGGTGATLGRQRIILDNARFVGNVGWRQNEQTFDAIRAQGKIGPVTLDATYAISQRTIFGSDSPNEFFDGDFMLLNSGIDAGPVNLKAFAYIIDYDTRLAFSSETYGVMVDASILVGDAFNLGLYASYATQSDAGDNPTAYSADFVSLRASTTLARFGVTAGYEKLGSDEGVAAFQTPFATLHAFQGWADLFLVTPANGIQDYYVMLGRKFGGVRLLPGLNANITYHQFDSDFGGLDYGSEWDASLGFKAGPVGLLVKYANYNADGFGVDTEKLWLQAGVSF